MRSWPNRAAADLWRAYLAWCKRNGAKAIYQTAVGRRLSDRKGVRKGIVKTVRYRGIAVVDRSLLESPYDEPEGAESHADAH